MAAQERAKQAQQQHAASTAPPAAAPPIDLLSGDELPPPPSIEQVPLPQPPPAFDESLLPPAAAAAAASDQQEPPPPAFDDSLLPPQTQQTAPPPSAAAAWNVAAPPAPSAPDFDLLAAYEQETTTSNHNNNNSTQQQQSSHDVSGGGIDESAIEAIMGMEGLSEAEKKALIEEQVKILASIQASKAGNNQTAAAHSAADAFEQRSLNAAVGANVHVHGSSERTHESIQDGTALLVQCQSCQNWMNVTGQATLMLCPVCQTVSAIKDETKALTAEEAAQLEADMKLAQELQQEEYTAADRAERRQRQQQQEAARQKAAAGASTSTASSWMEWLGLSSGGSSSTSSPQRPTNFEQGVLVRGQVGVSRPPGAGVSATTGQEGRSSTGIGATTSGGSYDEEDAALLNDRRRPAAARVAESQPLFSCVADSITSVASSMQVALHGDAEGNVHGVDSSSLLAMPNVGRKNDGSNSSDQPYEPLNQS